MLKLNLGSFTVMFPGWLNIDLLNYPELYAQATRNNCNFVSMDLSRGLPFEDNSVDAIYCSHMIEHITYRQAEVFIKGCYRILKPGATMRLAVPDLEILVDMYRSKSLKELNKINEPSTRAHYDIERFWEVLTADHKACYDFESMYYMCHEAGFKEIFRRSFGYGNKMITEETKDLFPEISLYMEIIK